jgi:hypothetical protein
MIGYEIPKTKPNVMLAWLLADPEIEECDKAILRETAQERRMRLSK